MNDLDDRIGAGMLHGNGDRVATTAGNPGEAT
jgi:hypothetical protein